MFEKLLDVLSDPHRPGVLTSEFWLTLLGVLLASAVNVHPATGGIFLGPQLGAALPILVKLLVIGYAVVHYAQTRALVKTTAPAAQFLTLPDEVLGAIRNSNPEKR